MQNLFGSPTFWGVEGGAGCQKTCVQRAGGSKSGCAIVGAVMFTPPGVNQFPFFYDCYIVDLYMDTGVVFTDKNSAQHSNVQLFKLKHNHHHQQQQRLGMLLYTRRFHYTRVSCHARFAWGESMSRNWRHFVPCSCDFFRETL